MLKRKQEFEFEEQVDIRRKFHVRGYDKAISSILCIDLCLFMTMANPLGKIVLFFFLNRHRLSGSKVISLLQLFDKAVGVFKF